MIPRLAQAGTSPQDTDHIRLKVQQAHTGAPTKEQHTFHELTWLIRICCLSVQSATECNARCIFKLFTIISATVTPAHNSTSKYKDHTLHTPNRPQVAQVNEIHFYSSAAGASDGTDNVLSSLPVKTSETAQHSTAKGTHLHSQRPDNSATHDTTTHHQKYLSHQQTHPPLLSCLSHSPGHTC